MYYLNTYNNCTCLYTRIIDNQLIILLKYNHKYYKVESVMGTDPFFLDRRSRSRSSIYSLMRSFNQSRSPFVIRSFADPDPLFLTRSGSDRRNIFYQITIRYLSYYHYYLQIYSFLLKY